MKRECRGVEARMHLHFDDGARLDERDLFHVASCTRCSRFYDRNRQLAESLRNESERALSQLGPPDWDRILTEAREAHEKRARPVRRGRVLALWTTGFLPKAAAVLVVVGIGALIGLHQYKLGRARSFLRSDTVEFVDNLMSAPLFPESVPDTLGVGSRWFDASSSQVSLPSEYGVPATVRGDGSNVGG